MKKTLTIAALVLMLAPGYALAWEGCAGKAATETTASTCADGASWDQTTGACVPAVTS